MERTAVAPAIERDRLALRERAAVGRGLGKDTAWTRAGQRPYGELGRRAVRAVDCVEQHLHLLARAVMQQQAAGDG